MMIREATARDNEALCALDARTPLPAHERAYFRQPDDFFEKHELQPAWNVMVAVEDRELVCACAGAPIRTPLAGAERRLVYLHHERIAPEYQRKGLGLLLARALQDHYRQSFDGAMDGSYWFIASSNQQSRDYVGKAGHQPWPTAAFMLVLDKSRGADAEIDRIGPEQAAVAIDLINRTHQHEDLFTPYDESSFRQRLSRCPSYGWTDLYGRWRDGRLVAIAGLWRNTVADFGCAAGMEDELTPLLQALINPIATRWNANIVTFVSNDALRSALSPLCQDDPEYLLYVKGIARPENCRPLHVDPAYF